MKKRFQGASSGFTLLELLVVVAIVAILATLAGPSMRGMVQDNRLSTETNDLVGELALARSEAAKRNQRTILCKSTNPNAALPGCSTAGNDWSTGWVVFVDANGNNAPDAGELIRRNEGPGGTVTINSAADAIRFRTNGSSEAGVNVLLNVCDARGAGSARQLTVSALGRTELCLSANCTTTPTCP